MNQTTAMGTLPFSLDEDDQDSCERADAAEQQRLERIADILGTLTLGVPFTIVGIVFACGMIFG